MRRKKILKMRIFPRKNGSVCGKAAIFFWFSFRTNKIFCPKIKTITPLQDNLLFSYYHTETFKWHIFARAGNFWSHLYQTRLHMFFFSVSKRQTIRFRSWKCVLTLFCVSSFRKKKYIPSCVTFRDIWDGIMFFLDKNRKYHILKKKPNKNVNFYRHQAFIFVIGNCPVNLETV
jgi:hypothetical protein